jgi:hypothetical protein
VNTLTRVLILPIVALPALFMMCIGLIQAQPYDGHQLRALLTPPNGCTMPCFIGIRPGITRLDDAVAILRTHEWVGEVTPAVYHRGDTVSGFIYWFWNGQQPVVLGGNSQQTLRIEDGVVQDISIYTNIALADAWLLYGLPSRAIVAFRPSTTQGEIILNSNGYPELGLAVVSNPPCPTSLNTFWESPILMSFGVLPEISIMPANNVLRSVVYWNQACRH